MKLEHFKNKLSSAPEPKNGPAKLARSLLGMGAD
jgi:hypothetical protein